MNLKELCDALEVDAILGLDYETYYDDEYSVKKMATTEYIVDPRFKTHMVSAQWHDERRADVLSNFDFKDFAAEVDWKHTALLAHHTHFDGLILSHHYKRFPAFYLDTLSMANILMPVTVPKNLDSLARALGLRGKVGASSLENVKGVRDLSDRQYRALAKYAGNDIEQTFGIAKKLVPCLPLHELKLIDLTIKMYARPTVLVDKEIVDRVNAENIADKAALVAKVSTKRAPVEKADLVSNDKFAALLRAAGVEPPTKLRPKYAKQLKDEGVITLDKKDTTPLAFAFSKGDLEFKDLLKHPNRKVRELVQARLANKTSIVETRSARMGNRAELGPQPIYLKHAGAKTLRWSGADKSNWQNLGRGSDLRTAVYVPPSHKLIIADLAQIEARVNAWFSGQDDITEAFRRKEDVYSIAASNIYGRRIDKEKDPAERFVGKVAVLALGYQAGGPRFADMLRIGQFGPPVEITDSAAKDIVAAWRQTNGRIVANWRATQNAARSAFRSCVRVPHGCVVYEGFEGRGVLHGPNQLSMRYDLVQFHEDNSFSYAAEYRRKKDGEIYEDRTKLYGGILVENMVQFLARLIVAEQMVQIADALPDVRIVMSTHDEIVTVAPNKHVKKSLGIIREIMSRPPEWAKGLPIGVDIHSSQRYNK